MDGYMYLCMTNKRGFYGFPPIKKVWYSLNVLQTYDSFLIYNQVWIRSERILNATAR